MRGLVGVEGAVKYLGKTRLKKKACNLACTLGLTKGLETFFFFKYLIDYDMKKINKINRETLNRRDCSKIAKELLR